MLCVCRAAVLCNACEQQSHLLSLLLPAQTLHNSLTFGVVVTQRLEECDLGCHDALGQLPDVCVMLVDLQWYANVKANKPDCYCFMSHCQTSDILSNTHPSPL